MKSGSESRSKGVAGLEKLLLLDISVIFYIPSYIISTFLPCASAREENSVVSNLVIAVVVIAAVFSVQKTNKLPKRNKQKGRLVVQNAKPC